MQDTPIPRGIITDALKVLIGNESSTIMFYCANLLPFFSKILIFTARSFADVRNHPILIHCKRGKVCSKSSLSLYTLISTMIVLLESVRMLVLKVIVQLFEYEARPNTISQMFYYEFTTVKYFQYYMITFRAYIRPSYLFAFQQFKQQVLTFYICFTIAASNRVFGWLPKKASELVHVFGFGGIQGLCRQEIKGNGFEIFGDL